METTPTQLQAAGRLDRAVHLNNRGFYFRGSKAIRENRERFPLYGIRVGINKV